MFLRVFLSKTYLFLFSKKETCFKHSPPPPPPKKNPANDVSPLCSVSLTQKSLRVFFFSRHLWSKGFLHHSVCTSRLGTLMCRQNRCDQTLKPIQQRIACANDVAVWSPGLKLRISKTAGSWNRLKKKNENILQLEFLFCFFLEGEGTRFPLING